MFHRMMETRVAGYEFFRLQGQDPAPALMGELDIGKKFK